ncbi:MAG: sialidase family protein [Bryobacteraceae bacterium]
MQPKRILGVIAILSAAAVMLEAKLKKAFELVVAPSTENNKRNSEADILPLKDGRLMLAWNDFYTAAGSDFGAARIAAMFSRDGGLTWGGKITLQENLGTMNVMEPDLLRLKSGKVAFLFCRKNSEADCLPMARFSKDDGKTFSEPKPIPVTPYPSYTGMNPDRLIQLRTGRLIVPFWHTLDYRVNKHVATRVYYSDDDGANWKHSETLVDIPDSKAGAQEPGIVELKDGRLFMWIRTDKGSVYKSYSKDKGVTWTAPEPMNLDSPLSPQSIKRIPSTGHLVIIWNNSKTKRFPLTAAISKDDGETWVNVRNLDEDPAHSYAYTSIEFLKDRALFSYYAGPPPGVRGEGRWSLKLKVVPLDWFYK